MFVVININSHSAPRYSLHLTVIVSYCAVVVKPLAFNLVLV